MKCPNCGNQKYSYKEKRIKGRVGDKKWKRTSWVTTCNRCGYSSDEAKT